MHWSCACQQVHYPDNSRAAHDTHLLISFAIRVLRQLPIIGLKTVPRPTEAPQDSPADRPPGPMKDIVLRPVFMPCPTTTPPFGAVSYAPILRHLPVSFCVMPPCPCVLSHFRPRWMFFWPWT